MKKAVKIIAIIYSVLAGLACIVYVIAMFKGNILESLLGILSMAVSLVLLWAIYVALDRIDSLEAFVLKVKMAQSKSDIAKISEEAKNLTKTATIAAQSCAQTTFFAQSVSIRTMSKSTFFAFVRLT